MRRHALLLSLVGVLLIALSVPAVAKPGKGGPPDPGPYDLPACEVEEGAGTFEFKEACEWLPDGPGVWTISAQSKDSIRNLGLTLRDASPGDWCAVAGSNDGLNVSLSYLFEGPGGVDWTDLCGTEWPDNGPEFVINICGTRHPDGITITITGPTVP